jgi:hypothetical protein
VFELGTEKLVGCADEFHPPALQPARCRSTASGLIVVHPDSMIASAPVGMKSRVETDLMSQRLA